MKKNPTRSVLIAALLVATAISGAVHAGSNAVSKELAGDRSYQTPVSEMQFYNHGGIDFARGFGDPAAPGLHSN